MRRFVQDFFLSSIDTSDRYVQQIDRAMTTFYNFCNFNILDIVQFKFNSPITLLHNLSQSTSLNRLILIEYKNELIILITSNLCVYPTDAHLGQFSKINFPNKYCFFPIKVLRVTRKSVAFFWYN